MGQDNLYDIKNLFVYTKTNVDDMLARYTNTADLENNYPNKIELAAVSRKS